MSGEKSVSRGRTYIMHFVTYFIVHGTSIKLNTLRKVEDHEKPCEMDLSHNCSLHGGKYARLREIEFPHCQATLSRMYLRKVNDIIAAPLEFINELFMMKLL